MALHAHFSYDSKFTSQTSTPYCDTEVPHNILYSN